MCQLSILWRSGRHGTFADQVQVAEARLKHNAPTPQNLGVTTPQKPEKIIVT
jgi:hypothetical protein